MVMYFVPEEYIFYLWNKKEELVLVSLFSLGYFVIVVVAVVGFFCKRLIRHWSFMHVLYKELSPIYPW